MIYRLQINGFCLMLLLTGCSPIIKVIYGIRQPKEESKKEQIKAIEKWEIDTNYLFSLKDDRFKDLYSVKYNLDTANAKRDDFSPVQFRVYNSKGRFITGWQICYGPINYYNFFDTDAIKTYPQLNNNYNLTLQNDLELFDGDADAIRNKANDYDYVIVAFWARYLGKFSKDMLKQIHEYATKTNKKVLFLKLNLGDEPKEKSKGG